MSTIEGNPAALQHRTHGYVTAAAEIGRVAAELRSLGRDYDGLSEALDALRVRSSTVSTQLDRAHERYQGTAAALDNYAVALGEAHRKADAAAADRQHAAQLVGSAGSDLDQAQAHQRTLEDSGTADPVSLHHADDDVRDAVRRVAAAADAVDAAEAVIAQARHERDAAAELAIRRIDAAIDRTNDSLMDKIGAAIDDIVDFLDAVGRWIRDFLADVIDVLQRLVATVIAIVVVVALVAAALLIAAAMIAVGGFVGVVGALIAVSLAIALAVVVARIASDVGAPDPTVQPYEPPNPKRLAHRDGLDDVLMDTKEVDDLGDTDGDGKDDATVVKVVKVVAPDGTVRWRIVLPSTQEWPTPLGDGGAVNDLDSNLALMLTPALQTQYERAVLEAMRQAGVGPGDPVMLVGFSQGGILAGHLAAYNHDYNWDAVVVSGAPIDGMPIPHHTTVVSVQHHGDPVPALDLMTLDGAPKQSDHWTTIQGDAPAGGVGQKHNAANYSDTLGAHARSVGIVHPGLSAYFDAGSYGYSESYYAWAE